MLHRGWVLLTLVILFSSSATMKLTRGFESQKTIRWIAIKCGTLVHVPLWMNCNNSGVL